MGLLDLLDYKDAGPAWRSWRDGIVAMGGAAVTWPFKTGIYAAHFGKAAARFSAATYADNFNAGRLDRTAATQTGAGNVFVLAPADAVAQMPQGPMTAVQAAANAGFTAIDKAADAVGLPDLGAAIRKYATVILVVLAVVLAFSIYRRIQRT